MRRATVFIRLDLRFNLLAQILFIAYDKHLIYIWLIIQTKSRFLHNKESEIEVAPEGWRVTSCSNRGIWSRGLKYYQQRGVGDLLNHTKLHAFALFLFQEDQLTGVQGTAGFVVVL